jgi:hypothetical protein
MSASRSAARGTPKSSRRRRGACAPVRCCHRYRGDPEDDPICSPVRRLRFRSSSNPGSGRRRALRLNSPPQGVATLALASRCSSRAIRRSSSRLRFGARARRAFPIAAAAAACSGWDSFHSRNARQRARLACCAASNRCCAVAVLHRFWARLRKNRDHSLVLIWVRMFPTLDTRSYPMGDVVPAPEPSSHRSARLKNIERDGVSDIRHLTSRSARRR